MVTYASLLRPVAPGAYPRYKDNKVLDIQNFDDRKEINGVLAWGTMTYAGAIPTQAAENYDLKLID